MPDEAIFFLAIISLGGGVWLLTPLVRALAERIKPRATGLEPGAREELQRLRDELFEEVGQLRQELAELGERMDFAERWLAKQGGQALPRPGA